MTNQEMKNYLIEFIVYFVLCDGDSASADSNGFNSMSYHYVNGILSNIFHANIRKLFCLLKWLK